MKRQPSVQFQFFLALSLTLIFGAAKGQCPTITVPNTVSLTSCTSGQTVAAVSNYSTNITSRWIGYNGVPMYSTGTATSVVYLNFPWTYTVEFTDNVSNCSVSSTVNVVTSFVAGSGKPVFQLASPNNFSLGCGSQSIGLVTINNAAATNSLQMPTGGPVSFTFISGSFQNSSLPTGTLSSFAYSLTPSACGVYCAITRDNVFNCTSSFDFVVSCPSLAAQPISIAVNPNTVVCSGSNVTLTASGASSYTWNTGQTGNPIILQTPASGQSVAIAVIGTSSVANTCYGSSSIAVTSNSNCTIVWPGDANSDGNVNTWDVLELGLQYSSTGINRSPGGNTFTGQYATTWTGTVSTGKNKAHADCNGDGAVNVNDTLAIYTNFNLTHAFKPSPSAVGDVSLVNSNNTYMPGRWNTLDVMYGELNNVQNQVYGLAFDINYDGSIIENDSIYLVYTPSFLNASGQNIQFKKPEVTSDRIYAATVRTNGSNVSGQGKIGELRFKASAASTNTLQISLNNVNRINANGISQALTGSNQSFAMTTNLTGINNIQGDLLAKVSPNPSTGLFTIQLEKNTKATYQVLDLNGRLLQSGAISGIKGTLDLSQMPSGVYYLQLTTSQKIQSTKLIVVH